MLRNLMAEMKRVGIINKDLAETIGRDEKSISNKILCKTEFTRREMVMIKKVYFPDLTMDYLFEQSDSDPQVKGA